jgi:hypothetical protein
MDGFFSRMREWFDLVEQGFVTTPERQNPTRSDCHGWSAHPLVHYFATILGIRPASLGFNTVTITPQLGSLTAAQGRLPHPRGEIVVEVRVENGVVQGSITLPDGVTGNWRANGQTIDLRPGQQEIR